ncbi:MAG: GNAT family N-acetyltransferase [Bacteroidota bacterium]
MWNEEYPVKLKDRFPLLLEGVVNYNHYLIEDEEYNVLAWAVIFEKEQQIRFSIIVAAAHMGKGLGGLLIDTIKRDYTEFYGWVIDHNNDVKSNGEQYRSPMPFYLRHGFEILKDERIDTEMIRAVKIKWKTTS